MQFQNADICSLLLCCFLRPAFSDSVFFFSDMYRNTENLIMIRSLFTNQMIRDYFFKIRLHDFLQDSLAIKKEFLVLQIFQNKSMYKLFCISKTTIKINCSDQSLHCIRCYRFSLSSSGSIFSFTKQKVFAKIEALRQPSIAMIPGFALGGGCELALACDIRIASEKARFGQPEVGLGITAGFGGTQRLPRLVGRGAASLLLFSGNMIDAAEAGTLTLEKLEAMTAVCSVGLDMIVLPGDTPADTISAIIADEAAIGMVNSKTTAVRVIPAIGHDAGEVLDFGGLLGTGPIMKINRKSSSVMIQRGGRIPAPMQSLKN